MGMSLCSLKKRDIEFSNARVCGFANSMDCVKIMERIDGSSAIYDDNGLVSMSVPANELESLIQKCADVEIVPDEIKELFEGVELTPKEFFENIFNLMLEGIDVAVQDGYYYFETL